MKLKNYELKKKEKKQANLDVSFKLGLIFQTYNPWNPRPRFDQKAQFQLI
jgi:hypothetical protein